MERKQYRWVTLSGIAVLGLSPTWILTGCSHGGPEIAEVTGKVTLDGKPLANANVLFQPVGESGKKEVGIGSFGTTDASGNFSLKRSDTMKPGAVVAIHTVTIVEKTDPANDQDAGGLDKVVPSRISSEYSGGFKKYEVKRGTKNQADFEVKSP